MNINWKWVLIILGGICVFSTALVCFVELLLGIDLSGTAWFFIGIPFGIVTFLLFGHKLED